MKNWHRSSLLLFALLVYPISGCCKKSDPSAGGEATSSPLKGLIPGGQPASPQTLKIARAGVEFTPPGGWQQEQEESWTIVHAPADPSGNVPALVAFVTFNQPGESTSKLGAMASVFELKNISWGGRENIDLPGGFPATGAGGTCKDGNGNPCEIHYYTINPGGSEQLLFIYIVDADKAATYKPVALGALRSLKKS